jgi:acyl-CoA reductase LuxC
MSEIHFVAGERRSALLLPFDLDQIVSDWSALRRRMIRSKPADFTRLEWAYLIEFLDPEALAGVFGQSFGQRVATGSPPDVVLRPGGLVAAWLPNNVSLLGALTLILLTLTGNPLRMKAGSRGGDLTRLFLDYALENLESGPLRDHLSANVSADAFPRTDSRNAEWAAAARCRLAFGSDEAVAAIHALPHPLDSVGFSFGHRESEAWLEPSACDDQTLTSLLKVFDVYGQAACTSPGRVALLDASREDALAFRERLLALWSGLFPRPPEMAVSSSAILDHQWSAALGWESRLAHLHGAAFAVGRPGLRRPAGQRLLCVVPLSLAEALESLPERIQTVGHGLSAQRRSALPPELAQRGVADMHRFGPTWDGQAFWRQTFAAMEAA